MAQTVLRAAARALLVSARMHSCGFCDWDRRALLGWGIGLNWAAFQFAAWEGGIPGGAVGLLVGLVTFYAILHGRASWKDWAILDQRQPRHCNVCVHGRVCSYRRDHTTCDDNGRSSNEIQVGLSANC